MTLTQIALIVPVGAGAVTVLAHASSGLKFLVSAVERDRITAAFARADEYLAVADRLDEIGEHEWAQERRRDARLGPLLRLTRYESNRARPTRINLELLAYVLCFLWVCLILAHTLWALATALATLSMLAALVIWAYLASTRRRVEALISAEAERRYETLYGPLNALAGGLSGTTEGPFAGTVNRPRFGENWQDRRRTMRAIQRRARQATKAQSSRPHDLDVTTDLTRPGSPLRGSRSIETDRRGGADSNDCSPSLTPRRIPARFSCVVQQYAGGSGHVRPVQHGRFRSSKDQSAHAECRSDQWADSSYPRAPCVGSGDSRRAGARPGDP